MSVDVQGPDGNHYQFPDGTDKAAAVGYFKKKGIGLPKGPAGGAGGSWDTRPPTQGRDFLSRNPRTGMSQSIIPPTTGINASTGGMVGSLGGPAGAAIGGALGRLTEQSINALDPTKTVSSSPLTAAKEVGIAGVEQGALEYVGGKLIPKGLSKASSALSSSADRAMNRILGLKLSDIPQWERGNVKAVEEVGKTVNKEIKGAASLQSLTNKIDGIKSSYSRLIDSIVRGTPGARGTMLHSVIDNRALQAANELELQGNKPAADQVLRIGDTLRSKYPSFATPSDLLDMKRTLLNDRDWESMGAAVSKPFRKSLYHDLNDAIKAALPADAAAKFGKANRTVNRLIIAEDAVKAKQVSNALAPTAMKEVAKRAAAPLAGASIGAGAGYSQHHTVGGALRGAAVGAVAGKAAESTAARSGAILARRAAALAARQAGRVAPGVPTTVRAIEAIRSAQQ